MKLDYIANADCLDGFKLLPDACVDLTVTSPPYDNRNIFRYSVGGGNTGHPAVFPEQLAADHIETWSNPNDIVLDPFMGSGTTAKMAILAGRHYVGFEISKEYCDMAQARLEMYERGCKNA